MPRRSKGARLHLRPARRDGAGHITHHATWVIRDGTAYLATGCAERETAKAEQALQDYIARKYQPARREQDIEKITVADVLSIFVDDRPELFDPSQNPQAEKFKARIERLNVYFGETTLAGVNGKTCRGYAAHRGSPGGARRDLEDLRAAINHHAKEGLHRGVVRISLPRKGAPRDRWLTRSEAARLIWVCWRTREMQNGAPTDKRPLRHLARFILIGVYSGTRAGAIASASPIPAIGRSFVDLERGVYYRLATGRRVTNKRQPAVPIAPRLLAHMRRWKARRLIARHFVEYNGASVLSVKTGFGRAVRLAKLEGRVSPHTLRHTAATWLMQRGTDLWQAAGYLGMSIETLQRVYGHHHPDHMADAVARIAARPKKVVSEAITVAVSKSETG